jgi:hypothetical protein
MILNSSQLRKLHTRRPHPVLLQPLVQFLANGLPETLEYTAMATTLQAQRVLAYEKNRMSLTNLRLEMVKVSPRWKGPGCIVVVENLIISFTASYML